MKKTLSGFQRQFSSALTKNIFTLLTGNAIAFVIPVILYPVLSRIFTQEDYALFGLYFSVFSFLEIASAGRYDFGIAIPEKNEDAINLVAGGLIVSSIYSMVVLILIIPLKDSLGVRLNNPALGDWLALLPLALFLVSVNKLCNGWLIRTKNFKASSINKTSQKLSEVTAQLAFGISKIGNGLILGDFAGRLLNCTFSIYQTLKSGFDRKQISGICIKANLKRYSELPKFGILPSMLNSLGGMLPVFIISSFYTAEVSGNFNFSRIILSVPFALIATGVSQVLMQQVSERRNKNESISSELIFVAAKLCGLSLIALLTLSLAGPGIFELAFGEKWRTAGEYTSILVFSTAVSFVVSPFNILLVVLGQIKWLSSWQIFYFLVVSMLWFLSNITIERFLVYLVVVEVLSYLIYGYIIYRAIANYEKDLEKGFV